MNAKRGLGSVEGEGAIDTGGHAGLLENVLVNGGPNTSVGLGSIDGDGAAGGQLSHLRPARGRRSLTSPPDSRAAAGLVGTSSTSSAYVGGIGATPVVTGSPRPSPT